jgi:hypothetical protein
MNRRSPLAASDRPAGPFGLLRVAELVSVAIVLGVLGDIGSTSASAQSAPLLPAACLPISGPNHGAGNQYEVRFKMLRNCDEAVGAFRSIVGQTAPERPDNSPRIWWDVAGWKCEASSSRQIFATYCESSDRGLAFYPIAQGLASPTTVLIGSVPDGSTDARILVNGSPAGDEVCVVSGPSVSARGRIISKWMVTGKSPDLTVGCAFAQTWLARMVRQTGHGGSRAMAVAPRGWKCWGTLPGAKAIAGTCKKNGTNGATFFAWTPAPN